jgi:DNA-binding response OmpR family regulator
MDGSFVAPVPYDPTQLGDRCGHRGPQRRIIGVRMKRTPAILVVDDDEAVLALIAFFLRKKGFMVMTTSTALGVSELIRTFHPDLIVLDQEMPAINGNRVAKLVRANSGPMVPLILYSASDPSMLSNMALETKNTVFVPKAGGIEPLYEAVCAALRF